MRRPLVRRRRQGGTPMDLCSGPSNATVTVEQAAARLGLGEAQASWLAELDAARPVAAKASLDRDSLAAQLDLLNVVPADAAEVLDGLPGARRDPELCWLLERSRCHFVSGLANRDNPLGQPRP